MNDQMKEFLRAEALKASQEMIRVYQQELAPLLALLVLKICPKEIKEVHGKLKAGDAGSGGVALSGDEGKEVTLALLSEYPVQAAKFLYPSLAYAGLVKGLAMEGIVVLSDAAEKDSDWRGHGNR